MNKPDLKQVAKKEVIKNGDIRMIVSDLLAVKSIKSLKVNSAIVATVENLKAYYEAVQQEKVIPMPEVLKEYQKKLQEIHEKYATDENGVKKTRKILDENGDTREVLDVPFGNPDMVAELKTLQEEYKTDLDAYDEEYKEYLAFLEEEVDPAVGIDKKIVKVDEKYLPVDITTETYIKLRHILTKSE